MGRYRKKPIVIEAFQMTKDIWISDEANDEAEQAKRRRI